MREMMRDYLKGGDQLDNLKFKDIQINNRKYYTADFKLASNSNNKNHTHDFYEVITITSGEFIEYNNGEKFVLEKGWFHFIKPTDKHYLVTSKKENNILRNIVFEHDFFKQLLEEVDLQNTDHIFKPFKLDENTFDAFLKKIRLLDKIDNTEKTNMYLLKSIFFDMIFNIKFCNEDKNDVPKWLGRCYMKIQEDENYIKGLPYLIQLSGKSQSHLTRQLKKYYHITPTDFINNLRVQKTASLLCLTDEKILEVALECGFENMSYYNRIFKEKYGVTPRQYRDMNNKFFK